jgi:HD-GYP domain-containing protein (c-di-GMP phosphodiesterase class II)
MATERINTGEIIVGKSLPWPVYDAAGVLLLKKGMIIQSERQLQILLNRGLYRSAVNRTLNGESRVALDDTSPFAHIADFHERLKQAFGAIFKKADDAEHRIVRLANDIQQLCAEDSDALIGAVHLHHDLEYTAFHPIHVAILCEIFAEFLKIDKATRLDLLCAALTANVSILKLQAQLHAQPGSMTEEQKQQMDNHPLRSVEMLEAAGISNPIWLTAVEQHHERKNGLGYPRGLQGEIIMREAKIIALSDIYSAMVVAKSYRDAHPAQDILREMFINKGKEFDEQYCLQLIKIMGVFPPGSFVKLANGETAVVTTRASNGDKWPKVASILSPRGGPYGSPLRRDSNKPNYKIKAMCALDKNIPLNLRKLWNYR